MTYCTLDNLVEAHGQDVVDRLAIRPGDEDGSRAVGRAIAYADSLIDAKLSIRFALPLPDVPQLLVEIAGDLAMARLADTADEATEITLDRAKRAEALLKDIAEGKMNLGLPARSPDDSPQPVIATSQPTAAIIPPSGDKLFDRQRLRGL